MILFSNSGPFFAINRAVLSTMFLMSGGGCMIPMVPVWVATEPAAEIGEESQDSHLRELLEGARLAMHPAFFLRKKNTELINRKSNTSQHTLV